MLDPLTLLTQTELLALAIDASRRDDVGHAMAYLKAATAREDATPQACFMLGSEYAQLGMTTEAKASMARAVELRADFALARFQLGMLHLTTGEPEAAKAVWAPLEALNTSDPEFYLSSFHRGMVHLIADEFDQAVQAVVEGIANNKSNEPLNADMRRVVDAIEHLPGRNAENAIDACAAAPEMAVLPQVPTTANAAQVEPEPEPNHLFINAYTHSGKPH